MEDIWNLYNRSGYIMIDSVIEVLKLASVGLVAGLFSSVLANRDHRHRKWWEMRVAAYQNVIESLSDLIYYNRAWLNTFTKNHPLSKEAQEKLNIHYDQAFPKVRKFADSGTFLFSEEAITALQAFLKDDNDPQDALDDYVTFQLGKAEACLNRLVECSKTDLQLKPSFIERLHLS